MRSFEVGDEEKKRGFIYVIQGIHPVLFLILLPYVAITTQRVWLGEGSAVLLRPDVSIMAAVLAGLSIGKLVFDLVGAHAIIEHKSRIVILILVILFTVLLPAICLAMSLLGSEDKPSFSVFIQPVLLIISISLFGNMGSIIQMPGRKVGVKEDDQENPMIEESSLISSDDPAFTKRQ
jgi:hypothetical protein